MLELIDRALAEDVGEGDLTTTAVVEPGARARARIEQKAAGVPAGLRVAEKVFAEWDQIAPARAPVPTPLQCAPSRVV